MRRPRATSLLTAIGVATGLFATPALAVTTTVYAAVDNKVLIADADANLAQTVYADSDLGIGCSWELYYYGEMPYQAFLCARSLLWFDVDDLIAGRTIQSAVLRVHPYLLPTEFGTTYSAAPIVGDWHYDTVTWANQPPAGAVLDTLGPPATALLPMDFDVTEAVRDWADGTRANRGLRLRDDADAAFPYTTADRIVGLESREYYFNWGRWPQLILDIPDLTGPTLSLVADPPAIPLGGSSTLHWQSTDATACDSTTRNMPPRLATSGSLVVEPSKTTEYGIACTGPGGEVEKRVTVTVPEPTPAGSAAAAAAALAARLKSRRRATRLRARH